MVEETPSEKSGPCRRGSGRAGPAALAIVAIIVLGAAIGTIATKAFAEGPFGWGPPPFGPGGLMHGPGDPLDPAAIDKRVERAVKHMSIEIDASDEQQARLITIAQSAVKDLLPMRDEIRQTREKAVDLLSAPTIDRAAIEQLRADRVQKIDDASKRLTQALAEAAEILTPEQRQQLARRVEAFHERLGGRWHRG